VSNIKTNLEIVKERVSAACKKVGRSPDEVTIIAVTKTVEADTIATAFELGINNFGENRVQEAESKIKELSHLQPRPTWHMIGHLQTNKVKTALELFDIIHSVDSVRLAEALSHRAQKSLPILLEVNVAREISKTGFAPEEVESAYKAISQLPNIEVRGLMTVAPLVPDAEMVRPVFLELRALRDKLVLRHLSMGMTDDFEIAIEEGATMVRIGRAIFGERLDNA
jgi:pyridoxal phosphate enzyme (YggS family)